MKPGVLYVVATPIGNLGDLTFRAAEVLGRVSLVAAEDPVRAQALLQHLGSEVPLTSYSDSSGPGTRQKLLSRLRQGEELALISAAGTPLISDPGYRLVAAALAEGVQVVPLPGASALTAALSVAGLATDRFSFDGFPPRTAARRAAWLDELRRRSCTSVLFEAAQSLPALLEELKGALGGSRRAVLAQELTKVHERFTRATLGRICRMAAEGQLVLKGEAVLLIAGSGRRVQSDLPVEQMLSSFLELCAPAEAARRVSGLTGVSRRELYALAQRLSASAQRGG